MPEKSLIGGLIRLVASSLVLSQKAQFSRWRLEEAVSTNTKVLLEKDRAFLDGSNDALVLHCKAVGCEIPMVFRDFVKLSSVEEGGVRFDPEFPAIFARDHTQIQEDMLFLLEVAPFPEEESVEDFLKEEATKHRSWSELWHKINSRPETHH